MHVSAVCIYIYIATTTHSLSPFSGSSLCSHLIALASPHHSNQISVTWNLEPGFCSSSSNVNIIIYTPIIPNAAASTPEAACVIPEFTPPAATPAAEAAKVIPPKVTSLIPEAACVLAPEGTASAADELKQFFRTLQANEAEGRLDRRGIT